MKRRIYDYSEWSIINWHKILNKITPSKFLVECWTCKAVTTKHKSNLLRNKKCIFCKTIHRVYDRDVWTVCWMLWLDEDVVRSRLTRWYTLKEALNYRCIPKESFRLEDLNYIYKQLEATYEEDKLVANRVEIKNRTNKFK